MAAPTKKLINSPETCADDSIDGYIKYNNNVARVGRSRVVVRADLEKHKKANKVCVLSGGGSGHEPIFLGYIGQGMLTAGVHGAIFAAPSSQSILTALRLLGEQHEAGVLVLYNNYTGDRLNFGIAVERAKAEGIKLEVAVLGEDCAGCGNTQTGRRGLAGCTVLWKLAGAMAEEGKSLSEIYHFIQDVVNNIGTIGVCLYPCSLPGSAKMFDVSEENMEFGIGLHGEAGWQRVKMLSAKDAVSCMIDHMIFDEENPARMYCNKGDTVAILLNNLGSVSDLEMNILYKEIVEYLGCKQIHVAASYSGRYATSLEMAAISITILILQDKYLHYLEAECNATAWPQIKPYTGPSPTFDNILTDVTSGDKSEDSATITKEQQLLLKKLLQSVCTALEESESLLNQLDAAAGDGDTGSTLKAGALALRKKLADNTLSLSSPRKLMLELSVICETTMGGVSGALYSIFLASGAKELEGSFSLENWANAMKIGMDAVTKHGQARPGDRSMVDPLHAALTVLEGLSESTDKEAITRKAVEAAKLAAEATAQMKPAVGRSVYVDPQNLTQPDPGATAVTVWLQALYTAATQQ